MNIKKTVEFYANHKITKDLLQILSAKQHSKVQLKGLTGSSSAFVAAGSFSKLKNNMLCILPDKEESAYFYNDLCNLLDESSVLYFPSSYKRSMAQTIENKTEGASVILRTEVLDKLSSSQAHIVVTYPEALLEKVVTKQNLKDNTLPLRKGEKISINFLKEVLVEYGFNRVDFVYEPGQYAIRGSIVDIFSFSNDFPFRIDFFGDEVESIRTFDIINQLSKSKLDEIAIIPNVHTKNISENRISFFDFISDKTEIWSKSLDICIDKIKKIFENTLNSDAGINHLTSPEDFAGKIENHHIIEIGNHSYFKDNQALSYNTCTEPAFRKNFNLLGENLIEKAISGFENFILSENEKQIERLKAIFSSEKINKEVPFSHIDSIIHEGFTDNDLKISLYTEHQIFERYHKFKLKESSQYIGKEALTIKEINGLKPGDYVVHIDHGVGVFGGLEKIDANGKTQEVIRLVYQDKDVLYVSIHSLHKISKYKGKDGEPPKIYKLGSGAWAKIKSKTKSKVKDIAKELIQLYAQRKAEKGFQFSADTYLQQALEASFIYEDTPDQVKATADVKKDMEKLMPMDRLICGDVGFGKTEIAIRAAFKAVCDSKQVAVLVPTTILALQHYKTFSDRLKDLPCNIDFICRIKTTKEQKEIIKKVEEGKIDILVGTHRIVSQDVKFKDLGLLIIDEEQKFGVGVKEKLKKLKVNVDTMTMSATPIPRTMQFSLMGARDMSILQTPPPNRYPILTELHTFNEEVITEAINYELERSGQVFFIHNRVENILEVETMIKKLCPSAITAVAHGQMDGHKLEQIMLDFINEKTNVLIATTIIENGLDIPNANTIIINDAHKFGLSDMHQLRGRVGRSNKKAFCYLLAPPITVLTPDARRRLTAIENFAELGSGFNIALQDLDIRGAGNLLGAEQSGFIAEIGFETYQRILEEALLELRENEYKSLNVKATPEEIIEEKAAMNELSNNLWVTDCQVDTDLEILFPDEYIENVSERIKLYRELDNIKDEPALQEFEKQLIDRFGKIPDQSIELLNVVKFRWLAMQLGFEKILLKNKSMICYFVTNQNSPYFDSMVFRNILAYMQKHQKSCEIKEAGQKLTLRFKDEVTSIKSAINKLKTLEIQK